ncbi:MAG: glycoside hydrolase family 55 protein [Pirellulaceae bacterium]|nr:glycoside hydrolase family 55 protein [Pirellulaceae bacterium]
MEHIFSVQSLDELKQVMPESCGAIQLLGHSQPGDGGGGLFHWNSHSMANPDDGIVVAATTEKPGRWHRLEADPINVKWYGAQGNGSDATAAIQGALDAAAAGGTVRLPSGKYTITQPLRMHQGTSFLGDGLFSILQYSGPDNTGCIQSTTPDLNCAFSIAKINIEVFQENAWGIDLRGMSFSRFDHLSVHLRKANTSGFFGPGDGKSPYYNLFTSCHIAGTGDATKNGCTGYNFTYDAETEYQGANANQIIGGHINTCHTAVACYGTGNVFYGQVFEDGHNGYLFDLPPGRLNDRSKGTINTIAGLYTEYINNVVVQRHESCTVTAEVTHSTGYEKVFDGISTKNSILITGHEGRLEVARGFVHRNITIHE